jgi:NAD-dependent dihydropyrimidine dehydrogenase PreA subunit
MKYLKNVATIDLRKDKCTGCKRCVEVCPRAVFTIRDNKAEIVDRDLCIECGACQKNCAFGAITVKCGVGCAQALFNALITGGEPVCDCEKSGKKSSECC